MNEEINYEIEQIHKYLKEIENMNIESLEEFKNTPIKHLASSMCIFSILNSCIELGENLITKKKLETPLKYKEIFEILRNNNLISKKTGEKLSEYMYIRNMLAHQYGKINLKKVYEIINSKKIILDFMNEIKNNM
ncbi:MAG: DUF86 domain-containing protein [Nanoarchaeota archaeon]|nr:DUF86 domain-containing protein [Nanoarchaeota archaeon]